MSEQAGGGVGGGGGAGENTGAVQGHPEARRCAGDALVQDARTSRDPALLVAAALVPPGWPELLVLAAATSTSTRERQLVAVASAHLRGDHDRALLLARDHLADHPDAVLVAHIAALSTRRR